MNTESLYIAGIDVEIHWKKIKNLHLGVYPPDGRVRVAAPEAVSIDAIKLSVLTRMPWIRRRRAQFAAQERQAPRRYVSGETHFLFGKPLRLIVSEWDKRGHQISRDGIDRLSFLVPSGSDVECRRAWMMAWRRSELRKASAPRIEDWSERLGVSPTSWGIRPMKTKWGSCNPDKRTIWLNTELSGRPSPAIDYVILHELAHLISPRHDEAFMAVLDRHMPSWRQLRAELNALPLPAWQT